MGSPCSAKGNCVVRPRARKDARRVVVRITIRLGTRVLENLRICRGTTRHRIPIQSFAAVLVRIEHVTRAPAPNGLAVTFNGKL